VHKARPLWVGAFDANYIAWMGAFDANYIALSDRDLSGLQTANDAVAANARFSRYRALRRDLYLRGLWGHHHSHNQN
jgi:hypothetical protein